MALYLVSYNLNKPEQDYPELVDYLYLIGARKVLDSEPGAVPPEMLFTKE